MAETSDHYAWHVHVLQDRFSPPALAFHSHHHTALAALQALRCLLTAGRLGEVSFVWERLRDGEVLATRHALLTTKGILPAYFTKTRVRVPEPYRREWLAALQTPPDHGDYQGDTHAP